MNQNGELKICVYAICKNESKFVHRWLDSLKKEADCIVVLDTGSTDNTVELLQQYSPFVRVEQKIIDPWRFDTARNESMKLIPEDTDICVVSDFDQIFRPGWAAELRRLFQEGYQEVYGDIIDYDDDNNEIKRFLSKNVHPYSKDWYWERPIHEGVNYHGTDLIRTVTTDNFVIEHHPDRTKSRDSYLELLENEYKENSKDPYCAIYYGCELCFHDKNLDGLAVFLKALEECDFTNTPEIGCQICVNVTEEYIEQKNFKNALYYALKGLNYGIRTRRVYMNVAKVYYELHDYDNAISYAYQALSVTTNLKSWLETQSYFEGGCYDFIALAAYANGDYTKAISYGLLALQYSPSEDSDRLKNNYRYYLEQIKENL